MDFVQNGMTKNLRRFFSSIVEFLYENCDKKLHRQSVEKIPKWSLAGTKPTYDEKGKKEKMFCKAGRAGLTVQFCLAILLLQIACNAKISSQGLLFI